MYLKELARKRMAEEDLTIPTASATRIRHR